MSTRDAPVSLLRCDSPLGRIELTGDGTTITSLSIERDGRLPHDGLPEASDAVLERAAAQLDEYFAGTRQAFDLPLSLCGTPFQQAVWEQLAALPYGETSSYAELGATVGRPRAARAVGGAVGANPIPIIVPCHRVLGADGRITGYSAGEGAPTKAWLLAHEAA